MFDFLGTLFPKQSNKFPKQSNKRLICGTLIFDSTFNQFNQASGLRVKSFNVLSDVSKVNRRMMSADENGADSEIAVSRLACQQGEGRLVCA